MTRPQRVVAQPLQARLGAEDRERLAGGREVALARDIAQPQLQRLQLELSRYVVDQRLHGERRRRRRGAR